MATGKLVAVIGDEDSVTGFLLAGRNFWGDCCLLCQCFLFCLCVCENSLFDDGLTFFFVLGVGQRDLQGQNFFVVKKDTKQTDIENAFKKITSRNDIAIILINQHVANMIRHLVTEFVEANVVPTVLEIPSKEHPYNPSQDPIMKSVNRLLGLDN